MKTVLLFGSFDVLHEGHKNLFSQAKEWGDEIIVVLAKDETIEKIKGMKPLYDEHKRKLLLEETGLLSRVILGNRGDKYQVIRKIKPDVICLGYDQTTFTEGLKNFLKESNMNTKIVRLKPFYPKKYKSSIVKKELKKEPY